MAKAAAKKAASKEIEKPKRTYTRKVKEVPPIETEAQEAPRKPFKLPAFNMNLIVYIICGLALVLILVRACGGKNKTEENMNKANQPHKDSLIVLKKERDSILLAKNTTDSLAFVALQLERKARLEADEATERLQNARTEGEKNLSNINKRSNETEYRINKASSIKQLDSIYDVLKSSGRFKVLQTN